MYIQSMVFLDQRCGGFRLIIIQTSRFITLMLYYIINILCEFGDVN